MKNYYCSVLLISEETGLPLLHTLHVVANSEYEAVGCAVCQAMQKNPESLIRELHYVEMEAE